MITANMATMSSRVEILPRVVESLIPQVDLLRIYLNPPYNNTPRITSKKVVLIQGKEDLGDKGKLFSLSELKEDEYFFTVDDDIIYSPDYVKTSLESLLNHKRALITTHGKIFARSPITVYTVGPEVKNIRFTEETHQDCGVHVGGTGVMCFNTALFKPDISSWKKNMADCYVAVEAQKLKIPIICRKHRPMGAIKTNQRITKSGRSFKEELGVLNSIDKWVLW